MVCGFYWYPGQAIGKKAEFRANVCGDTHRGWYGGKERKEIMLNVLEKRVDGQFANFQDLLYLQCRIDHGEKQNFQKHSKFLHL